MWWQGEKSAPPLVKACIKSIRKYANKADVIVICENNYKKYVNLPDYVMQKFNKGNFTITHLSDIIRVALLYEYGGLWLDSTILLTQTIPENIFDMNFYSLAGTSYNNKNIAKSRWCVFLMAGKRGNRLFLRLRDCIFHYWSIHDEAVCYSFLDFLMAILYESDNHIKQMIDRVPKYGNDVFAIEKIMNKREEEINFIKGEFHKLNWKEIYDVKTSDGYTTVYSSILKEYQESENDSVRKKSRFNKKIKSFYRHIRKLCSFVRIKEFGFKIVFLEFINSCMRTSTGKVAQIIADKYKKEIVAFWKKELNHGQH